MSDDFLERAKFFRQRAVALREKARALGSGIARESMMSAAATWDELAQSAEREAKFVQDKSLGTAE
jgi:hypothetical protein